MIDSRMLEYVVVARLKKQDIVQIKGERWQIVALSDDYTHNKICAFKVGTVVKVDDTAAQPESKDMYFYANQKYMRIKE